MAIKINRLQVFKLAFELDLFYSGWNWRSALNRYLCLDSSQSRLGDSECVMLFAIYLSV